MQFESPFFPTAHSIQKSGPYVCASKFTASSVSATTYIEALQLRRVAQQ